MVNIKQTVKDNYRTLGLITRNLDRLIESAALVVVAVTCYLMVRGNIDPNHLSEFSRWVILGSSVVIAMRGALESLKFLANK